MKIERRQFLHLAAGAAALPVVSRIAGAQTYPTRPVRLIVGFPPGGTADVVARLMGQWLSERLGQQIIVENRAGAANNVATETVVRAPPDGYTLLEVTNDNAINATLYEKLNFDFLRDIALVAGLSRSPLVLEVHPSVPTDRIQDLIAYVKANPGRLNLASFGTGSVSHLAGELFKMMTGLEMVHVPYRGSAPMLNDLLGGQVQIAFDNLPASIEHVKAGRLRALAVGTITRSEVLPDIPALSEFLPGYEASGIGGIGVPRNTPFAIVDKLNIQINAILADEKVKSRFAELGAATIPGSPADFRKLMVEETDKWAKVIRAADVKVN